MHLNTITLDEAALRARITDPTENYFVDFTAFDTEDYEGFDYYVQELSNIVSELIHSDNPALAGTRPHPANDSIIEPTESIDMLLSAGTDGIVTGYHWTYNLWGARRLEVITRYVEGRYMYDNEEADPIDLMVEMGTYIVALVNEAIRGFNEFVAGVAA